MKKLIIAAAIILTSGLTALSVTKKGDDSAAAIKSSVNKADFAVKAYAASKSDVAVIE